MISRLSPRVSDMRRGAHRSTAADGGNGAKTKPSGPRKVRRNPIARELGGGKFRPRVVSREGGYRRRPKHREPPDEEGQ